MTVALVAALVALAVAGWALWFALLALVELRTIRQALSAALQQAADEEIAKTTALRMLDELMVKRTEEVRAATARIQALQSQLHNTNERLH